MEFVYLQEDLHNPYKFTVCSETPFTDDKAPDSSSSSSSLKYLTLSKYGITRHDAYGESENYTFQEFTIEQNLYQHLLEIPIFCQFCLWYVCMYICSNYRHLHLQFQYIQIAAYYICCYVPNR